MLLFVLCLTACGTNKSEGKVTVLPDDGDPSAQVVFTVSFVSDGGSAVDSVTAKSGEKISEPSDPVRSGYDFVGWCVTSSLYTVWDFDSDIVTSNTTLYAKWKLENPVFVDSPSFSFSASDGALYTVSSDTSLVNLTDKIILDNGNYTYAFFTDESCKSPVCEAGTAVFSPLYGENVYYMQVRDSTLAEVAVYRFVVSRKAEYSISYYGLSKDLLAVIPAEDGSPVVSPADFSVEGYTVVWKTASGAVWKFGDSGTVVSGDTALYAYATANTYVITLDASGGTVSEKTRNVAYGEYYVLPTPRKDGACFTGWYTSAGVQITAGNAVSISAWRNASDLELIASWSNIDYTVKAVRTVDGVVEDTASYGAVYGQKAGLVSYDGYSVKTDKNEFTLYVFDGWYSGNEKISSDRNYTVESVTGNTSVIEKWYTLTVQNYRDGSALADGEDISAEFSSNAAYEKYGNINAGGSIAVALSCVSGKYTFVSWADGGSFGVSRTVIVNGTTVIRAVWAGYSVNVSATVDGKASGADGLYTGAAMYAAGRTVTLNAVNDAGFTFGGWFGADGVKLSAELSFSYIFEMTAADVTVYGKWYTTAALISVDNTGAHGRIAARVDENIIGADFSFDVSADAGYMLSAVKADGKAIDGFTYSIPSEATLFGADYISTPVVLEINIPDAGGIYYTVNGGDKTEGTDYGGAFTFAGTVNGDRVKLLSTCYDGYIWLGWYDGGDGSLLSSDAAYTFNITSVERTVCAAWKRALVSVSVTSGVYSVATVTAGNSVPADRYYEYSDSYTLTADKNFIGTKKYYLYTEGVSAAGAQTVTSSLSRSADGIYTLATTVSAGYRFEGWFDSEGKWLSFDTSYGVNVRNLETKYTARFTYIADGSYPIKASVYDKNPNAGTVSVSAYKVGTAQNTFTEYCRITVQTTKNEVVGDELKGYNFLGVYDVTGLEDYTLPLDNTADLGEPVISDDRFTDVYEIAVTPQEKSYCAAWSSTGYYITASIKNSDKDKGSVYYLARQGKIILVAEPDNGYSFAGWQEKTGTDASAVIRYDAVYKTNSDCSDKTFTAMWREINTQSSDTLYKVTKNIDEAGTFLMTAEELDAKTRDISFSAVTNGGYVFLGWYCGDKLLTLNSLFDIVITSGTVTENGVDKTVTTAALIIDSETYSADFTETAFSAKWKKFDSRVVFDSVCDTEITGFAALDGEGALKYYYTVKNASDLYFDDGTAYYGANRFIGWYGADGGLAATEYCFTVSQDDILSYYRAVWVKTDVSVTVTVTGDATGACKAFYGWKATGDAVTETLVLRAYPASGFIFNGWFKVVDGEMESSVSSKDLIYTVPLAENTTEAVYVANFGAMSGVTLKISVENNYASAEDSDVGSPSYYVFKKEESGAIVNYYVLSAGTGSGYAFLRWTKDNVEISRSPVYTLKNALGTYTAVYTPITAVSGLQSFGISSSMKENVCYTAYYDGASYVVDLKVTVPDGYIYTVSAGGAVLPADADAPYEFTTADGNKTFTVIFTRCAAAIGGHIEFEREYEKTSYTVTGGIVAAKDYFGNSYYYETRILDSRFSDDGYSFIGWYGADGEQLSVSQSYTVAAPESDTAYSVKYGKYTVGFDDSDGGTSEAVGYEVTVNFNINNTDIDISKSGAAGTRILNVGDGLDYNTVYLDRTLRSAAVDANGNYRYYVFAGWYDNADCDGSPYDFTSAVKTGFTLYAKWICLNGFGVSDGTNALSGSGEEKTVSAVNTVKTYYYVAVSDGYGYLYARTKTAGKTVIITVDGISYELSSITYGYSGIKFPTAAGEAHIVTFCSKTSEDSDIVYVKLYGETPEDGGLREGRLAYGAAFTAEAHENGGYTFEGWYIGNKLVSKRTLCHADNGGEKTDFYVYDTTVTIGADDFALYADADGKIVLTPKWGLYTVTLVNTDADAGGIGYEVSSVDSGANAGAKIWEIGVTAVNSGYIFNGWQVYDAEKGEFASDFISTESAFEYIVCGKDIIIAALWGSSSAETQQYTIQYTLGSEDAVNSPYNQTVFYSTDTTVIKLYDPTRTYSENGESGYYIFEGWYIDEKYAARATELDPFTLSGDVTLYAKWGLPVCSPEIYSDASGKYVYIGSYPQTLVTSETVLGEINSTASADGFFYDKSDNKYVKISIASAVNYNGTVYGAGSYFFKVEPLKWNVLLENGKIAYIECASALDATYYNVTTGMTDADGAAVYADNWENSDLRAWLNGDFLSKYFTTLERNLISLTVTDVGNSENDGNRNLADADEYPWIVQNDTQDEIFVMSYAEKTEAVFGYETEAEKADGKRICHASAYAVFRGIYSVYDAGSGEYGAYYWMRSPADGGAYVYCVNPYGVIVRSVKVSENYYGVRPVMRINLGY
jgi:uncharacterized repeat protein (TIGR02543 family)